MRVSVEGEEAKALLSSVIELVKTATLAVKHWGDHKKWQADDLESKVPVSTPEVDREHMIRGLEMDAREAEARVRVLEANIRSTSATQRQEYHNKLNHGQGSSNKPQKQTSVPRSNTNERRNAVQEGKKTLEGSVTVALSTGDSLKTPTIPS